MATFKKTTGQTRDKGTRIEFDSKSIRGLNGASIFTRAPQIDEHFVGIQTINSAVPQNFVTTETGAATPFAVTSGSGGGAAIGVTGATTLNAEELAGKNVMWKPSTMALERPLRLEVRAKFVGATTATDGQFFIGFADAVTYASGKILDVAADSTYTTNAAVEFAGFGYSSVATSGTWFTTGGNNIVAWTRKASGTIQGPVKSTVVKDSLYHIYRVEVDVNGAAYMFLDDKFVAYKNAAVTATVALTPYISMLAANSHTETGTVDYVQVASGLSA